MRSKTSTTTRPSRTPRTESSANLDRLRLRRQVWHAITSVVRSSLKRVSHMLVVVLARSKMVNRPLLAICCTIGTLSVRLKQPRSPKRECTAPSIADAALSHARGLVSFLSSARSPLALPSFTLSFSLIFHFLSWLPKCQTFLRASSSWLYSSHSVVRCCDTQKRPLLLRSDFSCSSHVNVL